VLQALLQTLLLSSPGQPLLRVVPPQTYSLLRTQPQTLIGVTSPSRSSPSLPLHTNMDTEKRQKICETCYRNNVTTVRRFWDHSFYIFIFWNDAGCRNKLCLSSGTTLNGTFGLCLCLRWHLADGWISLDWNKGNLTLCFHLRTPTTRTSWSVESQFEISPDLGLMSIEWRLRFPLGLHQITKYSLNDTFAPMGWRGLPSKFPNLRKNGM
jgi:hypothetical protein